VLARPLSFSRLLFAAVLPTKQIRHKNTTTIKAPLTHTRTHTSACRIPFPLPCRFLVAGINVTLLFFLPSFVSAVLFLSSLSFPAALISCFHALPLVVHIVKRLFCQFVSSVGRRETLPAQILVMGTAGWKRGF